MPVVPSSPQDPVHQELKLADDLFEGLAQGFKRVTVRDGHRPLVPGTLVFRGVAHRDRTFSVTVTEVVHTTLGRISDEDARHDGYQDTEDMVVQMRRFYPSITATSPVTLLRLSVAVQRATPRV